MTERRYSDPVVWSSLCLAPAGLVLLVQGSLMGLVYLASALVSLAYHRTGETRWRTLDHALAWSVIGCNALLLWRTRDVLLALAGVALVLVALRFYVRAKRGRYARRHSWWHLASGAACLCFVLGRG